jgi:hypothetical protein
VKRRPGDHAEPPQTRQDEARREPISAQDAEIARLRALLTEVGDLAASRAGSIEALETRNERLVAALQSVLDACDKGRMLERGAGGMTIDAQISRSFYYGVPAWPIEEARDVLGETP